MAMMEQAAGISALFDASGQVIIANERRLALHTRLQEESAAMAALINEREAHDNENA